MTVLTDAIEKYRVAAHPDVDRVCVADDAAEVCYIAATTLITGLLQEEVPVWRPVLATLKALRWSLVTRPRTVEGPCDFGDALLELRSHMESLTGRARSDLLVQLQGVVDAASALVGAADELAEELCGFAELASSSALCAVLVKAPARRATERALVTRVPNLTCLTPREFMGGKVWDEALLLGVSAWFPDEVFTAPRARSMTLVHHRWLVDRTEVHGLLSAGQSGRSICVGMPRQQRRQSIEWQPLRAPSEDVDWTAIEPGTVDGTGGWTQDMVPARLLVLAGGYGVYLEEDAATVRGLDPTCADGRWIRQIPADDIGPDSVVILREGIAEREALLPLVSEFLGDEASVRALQQSWKELLATALENGKLQQIRDAVGRQHLTAEYARYWAGPTCISPRLPAFRLLLEYLEISDVPGCIKAARELTSAHLKAGNRLSQAAERVIDADVLALLASEGVVTLNVPDYGGSAQSTLFQVVAVAPEPILVPVGMVRSAVKLKGTRWLE